MTTKDASAEQKLSRGQKLWYTLCNLRDKQPVSLQRAKLLTESYKETDGLPVPIRRAKALEKILTEIPIYIDDGQLLAGDFAARPMAAEWHPESTVEAAVQMFEEGIASLEEGDPQYNVRAEDMPLMKEIYDYWKDRGSKESFFRFLGKEEAKKLYEKSEDGAWIYNAPRNLEVDKGWYVPNYPKVIRIGLLGILDEVEQELQATPQLDDASRDKVYFIKALRIVLKAGIQYGKRYSALAKEMARSAEGERKKELERIAEVCDRVPAHPARNFYEALQSLFLCHLMIFWDIRGSGVSPGRVDQYLYPFYKRDIEGGILTREEAIELLECLRVKLSAMRQFFPPNLSEAVSGEAEWHNCTLGGQTAEGEDATNELSYLWIEAAMRTRTPHPTLSIRVHEKLSPDFALKAAELCSLGLGYPAWFGDKTSIPYLLNRGCTLEEARDYALAGCVLHVPPHKNGATWPVIMNMPKIFELALNNGVDPRTGTRFYPQKRSFEDMTYDELYEAFKEKAEYFIRDNAKNMNEIRLWKVSVLPQMAASCFFDDCIKRGQSAAGGGCVYQDIMYLLPIGLMDVVDSLAAIKKCVFEDGSVSKQELMEALKANFEGKEHIRQILLAAPKYGNDDDYADRIAVDLYSFLTKLMSKLDACYGAKYVNAPHNLAHHGGAGKRVGALPSGRQAWVSVADGAVSPCQGADSKGPTAVIKSCGKVDQLPIFGVLLNMKFHPSALKTKDDLKKFISLIKTYLVDYGGKHVQFNVISRETLLDAQAHPENYRTLVVRVAGYSALWVELNRVMQNEIISRTEHSFA